MNMQDYDLASTANMMFDELFQDDDALLNGATECTSRSDSVPYNEQQHGIPHLEPASPCYSEDSMYSSTAVASKMMMITGELSNINNKYHVDLQVLGSGSHGCVRECMDRVTGQRYAVKSICKSDPAVKPGSLVREIELLDEMKHCSIIQLVDVFEDEEYVHLVTDLCKGGELFDKIVEKASVANGSPCFAEDEAARIMYQILKAVSYMHRHDVAHRDIKPENILFETEDEDSPIKIIDFGLSRKHDERIGEPLMTNFVGTPYYIAPEILREKGYNKSCDLWSAGVIAYILLSGYPPFNGDDNREVHAAVQRGRYHFPSAEWSGMSRESRDFVRRLLQKDPRKRMTVEQALRHPWIVKNGMAVSMEEEEDFQDYDSSVEVVFNGSSGRDAIICGGDTNNKRKVKKALFADLYTAITDRLHNREPRGLSRRFR